MRKNLSCAFLAILLAAGPANGQDPWLTKAHDVRRTGQSQNLGPVSIDPFNSWSAEAPAGMVLNVGASVDFEGAYVGSWGLLRKNPGNPDPRFWDKSDGKLFGFALETGAPVWASHAPLDLVPRCYDYMARGPDFIWCGLSPYRGSFYNGTVEGQPAIDLARDAMYVGRGDGRLYALDRDTGSIEWRFITFNPEDPNDPDGGGELIASPLLGPDGNVFFGTWGEGPFETNAVYGVDPEGRMLWRYPSETSLTHRIFASPALSPDGSTIYVSTYRDDDGVLPGTLYAFNRLPAGDAPDESRLKWSIDLEWLNLPVQTATLAVGADGTVYVAGLIPQIFGVPVITAVTDMGDHGAFKWNPEWIELRDNAQYVLGVALREEAGVTTRLYATTANLGTVLFNGKVEGTLFALDPADGSILGSYDPSDDVPEAVGGLNSPAVDAAGRIYFGVRGRYGSDPINGHYFCVEFDDGSGTFSKLWNYEVDGHVEWNHPAIGPDGGLYVGSSVNLDTDQIRNKTYDDNTVPEGTTPLFYALKGPTSTFSEHEPAVPTSFRSIKAFPNPFSERITFSLEAGEFRHVQIHIRDMLGRTVALLSDFESESVGGRTVWDGFTTSGSKAAPGVYLATIHSSDGRYALAERTTMVIVRLAN